MGAALFEFDKLDGGGGGGDCNGAAVISELGASEAVGEANVGVVTNEMKNKKTIKLV